MDKLRRLAGFLCLVVVSSCSGVGSSFVQIQSDSLLVSVLTDQSGIKSAEVVFPSNDRATFSKGVDERIALFAISRADLVGADGQPLGENILKSVSAITAGTPSSGCGRCMAESATGPQLVFPGDLCPIPQFAVPIQTEWSVDESAYDSIRRDVRLAFPGDCPCGALSESFELDILSPSEDAEVFPFGSITSSGTVGLFNLEQGALVSPGEPAQVEALDGSILAPIKVAGLETGFVVAGLSDGAGENDARIVLTVLDSSFGRLVSLTTPLLRVYDLVYLPDERILLASGARAKPNVVSIAETEPALLSCRVTVTPPELDCADVAENLPLDSLRFRGLARTVSGYLVVAASRSEQIKGELVIFESVPPPGSVRYDNASGPALIYEDGNRIRLTVMTEPSFSGDAVGVNVSRLAATGDRVVACGDALGVGRLMSYEIGPDLFAVDVRAHACVSVTHAQAEIGCQPMVEPDGSVRVYFPEIGFYEVEPDGSLTAGPATCPGVPDRKEPPTGFDAAVRGMLSRAGGDLGWDVEGGVYSRKPGEAVFSRVYGTTPVRANEAFTTRGGALWSFGQHDVEVRAQPTAPPVLMPLSEAFPDAPKLVAYNESNDLFTVMGSGGSWLRRVLPESGLVSAPSFQSVEGFVGLYPLLGGDVLFLAPDRLVVVDADGRQKPIEVDWDREETSEVETEPPSCGGPFQSAAGRGGLLWIGGCDARLMRVLPSREGYRVEQVAFSSSSLATAGEQSSIEAVGLGCPDQVVVSSRGSIFRLDGPSFRQESIPFSARRINGLGTYGVAGLVVGEDRVLVVRSGGGLTDVRSWPSGQGPLFVIADFLEAFTSDERSLYLSTQSRRLLGGVFVRD